MSDAKWRRNRADNARTAAAADQDADLFLPSLQGSPNNPSRFQLRNNTVTADQAPPAGAFTGPAVMPAPPVYGSPTGFGAGDTGFNSSNAKRKPRARVPNGGAAIAPPQETSTFDPVPAPPPEVPSRPPTPPPPLPPEIYPLRAASGRVRLCRRRRTSCRSATRPPKCTR